MYEVVELAKCVKTRPGNFWVFPPHTKNPRHFANFCLLKSCRLSSESLGLLEPGLCLDTLVKYSPTSTSTLHILAFSKNTLVKYSPVPNLHILAF